ncbi:MAG TPA: hypothetical protein VFY13_07120, partial [Luteolibacter sp.]|nr:hypothetical protein [Luteolibacter sp.]
QHSIYRVANEGGASTSQLSIPIHQRVPSRHLLLTIHHKDNPKLDISAAAATRYPTELVFYAPRSGSWRLLAGQALVGAPDYDISQLRSSLGSATRVTPGPLVERQDYIKPSALPDIDPGGAAIDLKAWAFRKPVVGTTAGVVQIELDPEVLAGSQNELADLRLIQNGRQIPFVISPARKTASLAPQVSEEPDAQRPSLSRWRLEMPLENLPATRLTASSSSPLFSRRMEVSCEGRDSYGNTYKRFIATSEWTKSVNQSGDARLILDLGSSRLPASFTLETDNGDNPPIALEQVSVEYSLPSILAKITDDAGLHLYYGNPQARAPRYDLNLVSTTLRNAEKVPAKLSAQEALKPQKARGNTTSGSPWLWLALGGVVVVLLVVVAKLLPKPAQEA